MSNFKTIKLLQANRSRRLLSNRAISATRKKKKEIYRVCADASDAANRKHLGRAGSTPASATQTSRKRIEVERSRENTRKEDYVRTYTDTWIQREREREKGKEPRARKSGGRKSKERAEGMELGLILPPQSGAASDSICFKYMDRRVWAVAAARDATREKRKGERPDPAREYGYLSRGCIVRENRPALLSPAESDEERTNNPVIRHTTRFLGIP